VLEVRREEEEEKDKRFYTSLEPLSPHMDCVVIFLQEDGGAFVRRHIV
jgi:hypothetical protein